MVTSSMGTSIPGGPAAMPVYLFGAGYLVWMLGRRLWNLKEEHWEYRWSLTLADMRSQRYGYGQWARNDGRQSQSTWMERWFYTKLKFKPYPAQGSLWARSWHRMLGTYFGASWKYMTLVTVGLGAWIIFSISPEYWQRALDRGAWQYSMYVLFGMVGLQYTLMTTEQFLKPVRRDRVVAELLMANALLSLMMYFEFMLAMWIVPIAVRAPELLASGKMWLSVLASFSFAVFLIGVGSILIRFLQGPRSYWLIYLVFLMPAIVGSSALEEHMPLGLGGLTAIFFALGAILWWVAYRLWCQVEFGRLGRMGGVW
jgi:hypothetical protein